MKLVCLAAAMLVADSSIARAEEPRLAAGYDWSGLSAGVFGGWQSANFDQTELRTDAFGGGWWFPPGPNPGYSYDDNDGIVGLQLGWDVQNGNIVTGLGVEFGTLELKVTAADPNAPPIPITDPPVPPGPVTTFSGDLFGSLTGRVGIASDRWLAYIRAGVSLLDAEAVTDDICARSFCGQLTIAASGEDVLFGLTAGAGAEYALSDEFSVGAEYRFYHFEGLTVSGVASNLLSYRQTVTPEMVHTGRISLNYRF